MKDRMKASDVFAQKKFLFGEKVPFQQAFPQIEDIHVEVKETGEGVLRWREDTPSVYTIQNMPGHFVNCSNPMCYNGGFALGKIIRYMVYQNLTEFEDTESCQGYEGSPKGRKKYRSCLNRFAVKISIKYKEQQKS